MKYQITYDEQPHEPDHWCEFCGDTITNMALVRYLRGGAMIRRYCCNECSRELAKVLE
jgi:hypothetical protein